MSRVPMNVYRRAALAVALLAVVGAGCQGAASGADDARLEPAPATTASAASPSRIATLDRAAQATARNAYVAALVGYTDTLAWPSVEWLSSVEPTITFVATASTGPREASVAIVPGTTADAFSIAVLSKSGTCFAVWRDDSVVSFGRAADADLPGGCSATTPDGFIFATSW